MDFEGVSLFWEDITKTNPACLSDIVNIVMNNLYYESCIIIDLSIHSYIHAMLSLDMISLDNDIMLSNR